MQNTGVYLAIAFSLSLLLVKVLVIQFQKKLVDLPNERSSHTRPTPRGGGLGFIISFLALIAITTFVEQPISQNIPPLIWLSLIPLVGISFFDDWKTLPAFIRYLIHLFVSTTAVMLLGVFPLFSDPSNPLVVKIGAIILTIFGMTALINFYNFMDGLDGLVAGTSIIQLSFLAIWSENSSLWILVAAILGFLFWNWHPAKIFMGDSGSTFLGAIVAIALLSKNTTPSDAWAALTITLPIMLDTIYTLIRRLIQHENIFQAHRSHLFQRLHQSGWSHAQVSSLYIAASLILSLTLLNLGAIAGVINVIGSVSSLIVIELYLHSKAIKNDTTRPH